MKLSLPFKILTAVLSVLIVLAVLSWISCSPVRTFPVLSEGSYALVVNFDSNTSSSASRESVLILKVEEPTSLRFIQLTEPTEVMTLALQEAEGQKDAFVAPVLSLAGREVTLAAPLGVSSDSPPIQGVTLEEGEEIGRWTLRQLPKAEAVIEDESSTERWLAQYQEIRELRDMAAELQEDIRTRRSEVERLAQFATGKGNLREYAERELSQISKTLESLERERLALEREREQLVSKLAVSLDVTETGRLVSLSRRVQQLENEVYQGSLSGHKNRSQKRLESEKEKLKEAIAFERARISELSSPNTRRPPTTFDDIWRR